MIIVSSNPPSCPLWQLLNVHLRPDALNQDTKDSVSAPRRRTSIQARWSWEIVFGDSVNRLKIELQFEVETLNDVALVTGWKLNGANTFKQTAD